jgi:Family of unknown function (DUF6112)
MGRSKSTSKEYAVFAITITHLSSTVLANVSVRPDPNGLPGGPALQKLLNGLVFVGLLGCVAAVVAGGATWFVGAQAGNFNASMGGRRAVLAGAVGALVIGAAAALVNFFFSAGSAV